MLGSLARKLRAFGFDTLYFREGDDQALIRLARSEGRVILTSDRALATSARSASLPVLLLAGVTDGARMRALLAGLHGERIRLRQGPSRCSACNGVLARVSKDEASRLAPAAALERHRVFFACAECGKVYWRGSHWKKLRRLERLFAKREPG